MKQRTFGEIADVDSSEILGDISLNALGLMMIILLVCLLANFQNSPTKSETSATSISKVDPEMQEKIKARIQAIEALKQQLETTEDHDPATGLWTLEIRVQRLVSQSRSKKVNERVDYFIWIREENGKITGSMFGAKKHGIESVNYAQITGTSKGDEITLELNFTGAAQGGSEIAYLKSKGDRLVGQLKSGKLKTGYQNFEGSIIGKRIEDSLFKD